MGDTKQLTPTIAPSDATTKTVAWKSSDDTVAAVSDTGLVTAKAAGEATITVTTADGAKNATCAVTVSDPTIVATAISWTTPLTKTSLGVGLTTQIKATAEPSAATVTYVSDPADIVSIADDGTITALKAGSVTIYAKAGANEKKTAEVTLTVHNGAVYSIGLNGEYANKTAPISVSDEGTEIANIAGITWNGWQHGYTFNSSSVVTLTIPGDARVYIAGNVNNNGGNFTITTSDSTARISGDEVSTDSGIVLNMAGTEAGKKSNWTTDLNSVYFDYEGNAGTITLKHASTSYIAWIGVLVKGEIAKSKRITPDSASGYYVASSSAASGDTLSSGDITCGQDSGEFDSLLYNRGSTNSRLIAKKGDAPYWDFEAGLKFYIPVTGACKITVEGWNSTTTYAMYVDETDSTTCTGTYEYAYTSSDVGYVTLVTAQPNNTLRYLKSITISPAE